MSIRARPVFRPLRQEVVVALAVAEQGEPRPSDPVALIAVAIQGQEAGQPLSGQGYVELTGYAPAT